MEKFGESSLFPWDKTEPLGCPGSAWAVRTHAGVPGWWVPTKVRFTCGNRVKNPDARGKNAGAGS